MSVESRTSVLFNEIRWKKSQAGRLIDKERLFVPDDIRSGKSHQDGIKVCSDIISKLNRFSKHQQYDYQPRCKNEGLGVRCIPSRYAPRTDVAAFSDDIIEVHAEADGHYCLPSPLSRMHLILESCIRKSAPRISAYCCLGCLGKDDGISPRSLNFFT